MTTTPKTHLSRSFSPLAWCDGRMMPVEEATVPLGDRGFVFGEAVYEVLVGAGGVAFRRHEHEARLLASASGIGFSVGDLLEPVRRMSDDLIAHAQGAAFHLYVQVTGGVAERDHIPSSVPPLGFYGTIRPFDYGAFLHARTKPFSMHTLLDPRWSYARYKTTQLLGNVMGKRAAIGAGADEALFVDREGYLLEAASKNLFVVRKGRVLTPPLTRNILPGITRAVLLQAAPELVFEEELRISDIETADEVFVASTTFPVLPVTRVDARTFATGSAAPVTARCAELIDRLMARELPTLF